jgi:hypothetical protein
MTALAIRLALTLSAGPLFMAGQDELEIRNTKLETNPKHEIQLP